MNRTRLLWPAAALLAAGACKEEPPKRNTTVAVTVAAAERRDAPYVIVANGVVEPLQSVAVQSQVAGQLTRVRFREGEDVTEGQVLFEIDARPYQAALAQARAVLARDVAQATSTRRDAERYTTLAQKDYVTKSQADQAIASAAASEATVAADRAAVETAQLNVANATIRAPISGRTGGLQVKEGNLVRAGADVPLVLINQIHPILVRFSLPEKALPDVQRYSRGKKLPVQASPSNGAGATMGQLTFVDNGVDTTTGTVALKGQFTNEEGRLWPGQFVSVTLQLFVQEGAIVVPSTAVMSGQNGNYVYIVGPDNKVKTQNVTVGRTLADAVVIDKGLDAGLRVVTDGQAKLTPNATVAIKPSAGSGGRAGGDATGGAGGPGADLNASGTPSPNVGVGAGAASGTAPASGTNAAGGGPGGGSQGAGAAAGGSQ